MNREPAIVPMVQGRGFDEPLSELAQELRKPTPKECWLNSFRVIPDLHSRIGGEPLYSEGWAIDPILGIPFLIEHAWLEFRGKIIETTWTLPDHSGSLYFPAFTLNIREVLRTVKDQDYRFPVFRWFGGSWLPEGEEETLRVQGVHYSAMAEAYGEEYMKTHLEMIRRNGS